MELGDNPLRSSNDVGTTRNSSFGDGHHSHIMLDCNAAKFLSDLPTLAPVPQERFELPWDEGLQPR